MALIALSKIFKVVLKNLQTIESRTLKSEGTIINILVTFKDSHKLLFFSIVLTALTAFPKACEVILKTSKNLQLVPLDLRVRISTFSSSFSKFSFMFFKWLQTALVAFPRGFEVIFQNLQKKLKFVPSDPRVLISTLW